MARFLVTHSLLSSWLYCIKENSYEDATTEVDHIAEFLRVLRREPSETTEAMAKGNAFEELVEDIANGNADTDHEWYAAAKKIADKIAGGVTQVNVNKTISVNGFSVLLHGRLDWLKAGTIYDVKYTGKYENGKFFDSTQHPMYFELVPEADVFEYLVSNGTNNWTETYRRDETQSIRLVISNFFSWLTESGFMDIYQQYWVAK